MKEIVRGFNTSWLNKKLLTFHRHNEKTFFVVLSKKRGSYQEKVLLDNKKFRIIKIVSSKKTVCYVIKLKKDKESCIYKNGLFYMYLSFSTRPSPSIKISEVYKDKDIKVFMQNRNPNYVLFTIHSPKANKENRVIETGASK